MHAGEGIKLNYELCKRVMCYAGADSSKSFANASLLEHKFVYCGGRLMNIKLFRSYLI